MILTQAKNKINHHFWKNVVNFGFTVTVTLIRKPIKGGGKWILAHLHKFFFFGGGVMTAISRITSARFYPVYSVNKYERFENDLVGLKCLTDDRLVSGRNKKTRHD